MNFECENFQPLEEGLFVILETFPMNELSQIDKKQGQDFLLQ